MRRALLLVLALATPLTAQSSSDVDRAKLERIRKLSPEERKRLLERLERFKKLSEEERERIRQNLGKFREMAPDIQRKLREKAKNLTEEERKSCQELAAGFFRSIPNKKALQAFPRVVFFLWLRDTHPGELERLKTLSADDRVREFRRLAEDFRKEFAARVVRNFGKHARKHECATQAQLDELAELPAGEFWPRWREITRQCGARQKSIQKGR